MNTKINWDIIFINTLSQEANLFINKKILAKYGIDLAIFISFLVNQYNYFLSNNQLTEDKMFFATDDDIFLFTNMPRTRITSIKKQAQNLNIISIKKAGQPVKTYYKVNFELLVSILSSTETIKDIAYNRTLSDKELTEDYIRSLSYRELRLLCKKLSISYTNLSTKEDYINKILEENNLKTVENIENLSCAEKLPTENFNSVCRKTANACAEKLPTRVRDFCTKYNINQANIKSKNINHDDDTYSLIYKKIEKEPKVENPLSAENPNFSDFSPKVENPLAVNPLADNQRLLIIDNTNNRKTNNKNHDMHDELDFFENLFKELGVNFTKTNKESVLRIRKHLSLKDTELYLRETYLALKENKEVKNIGALFSAKIKKEERQINSKKNKQTEEVKNQEPEKENNKNNFIEKVTENKEKENNTNDTIILFNSLEINEKIKIEEKALALLISEENVNKKFILQTKEKAPKIYITMLTPYISRLMGLNK